MPATAPAGDSDLLFIVNSVFGGRNTPGFRPFQPIRFGTLAPQVIARGAAVAYPKIQFPLPGRSLIPRGLNLVRIKLWPGLPSRAIEQALFDRLCLWHCRRLGWRPRAVHLWDQLPETAAFWHSQGVPLVVDLQMAHPRCYQPLIAAGLVDGAGLGSLADPATDRCIALADRLVCPSGFVRDTLPAFAQAKAVVVPFGADPVAAAVPRHRPDGAPVRVLFAGNVNLRKGVPYLIEAWRRLPPEIAAQAELILCGRVFKEMAAVLAGAPAGIRAVGFQAEMAPWFAAADVFVLPSLMEGSAKAVYEAMAHGLPVVVSTHTGSVIAPGIDGLEVPPADAEALAAALVRVIADPALRHRLGTAARATVARYSWQSYAEAIADVHAEWPPPHLSSPAGGEGPKSEASIGDQSSKAPPLGRGWGESSTAPPPSRGRGWGGGDAGRLAESWAEHQAPRPLGWHLHRAADRAVVRVRALGRRIGGEQANWLRFPFYHHVFADERRGFARHLTAMRNHGEFVGLDDAVELLASGAPVDGRYFCLSFDDGFRNLLTHAAPILAERQVPAAAFVISGLTPDRVGESTGDPIGFFGPQRRPAAFLTWDDCRALAEAGWTIGAHGAQHRRLIGLSDAEAEAELALPKQEITHALGRACHHFACPWGKPGRDFQTERDPLLAARLGYRSFLTTKWGHMATGGSPFEIRRVGLIARYGLAQLRYYLSL